MKSSCIASLTSGTADLERLPQAARQDIVYRSIVLAILVVSLWATQASCLQAAVLDSVTPASPTGTVAYSVRKLRDAYVGSVMEVRRSSDNATQNIGFDANGILDVAALQTFVGAGNNGFVVRWFDQSGNGKPILQTATPGNQPQIVANGLVLKASNGLPAIRFDGVNDRLRISATTGAGSISMQKTDAFAIAEFIAPPGVGTSSRVFTFGVATNDNPRASVGAFDSGSGAVHSLFHRENTMPTATDVTTPTIVPVVTGSPKLFSISLDASQVAGSDTLSHQLNGVNTLSLTGLNIAAQAASDGNATLGSGGHMGPANTFFSGYVQEFIIFDSTSSNLSGADFNTISQNSMQAFAVPEPSSAAICACLLLGMAGLRGYRRLRSSKTRV